MTDIAVQWRTVRCFPNIEKLLEDMIWNKYLFEQFYLNFGLNYLVLDSFAITYFQTWFARFDYSFTTFRLKAPSKLFLMVVSPDELLSSSQDGVLSPARPPGPASYKTLPLPRSATHYQSDRLSVSNTDSEALSTGNWHEDRLHDFPKCRSRPSFSLRKKFFSLAALL